MIEYNKFEEFMRANPSLTEFDPSNHSANSAYVVSGTITVPTMTMQAGVTLYFMGGKLTGTGTLTGNKTKLIAPITQIFDAGLTIAGTWEIDRAYPQWFGAQTIFYNPSQGGSTDCAPAINKAIKMKKTGEVFLPRGVYRVNSSIWVYPGIALIGEVGWYYEQDDVDYPKNPSELGTTLIVGGTNYTDYYPEGGGSTTPTVQNWGFVIYINVDKTGTVLATKAQNPGTIIKNISFNNTWKNLHHMKGICAIGSFTVDTCLWHWFLQAVYSFHEYADQRRIVHCSFLGPLEPSPSVEIFAFDLNCLGDAFLFEQNAVHYGYDGEINNNRFKALRVFLCNGGVIHANVLNNDVLIDICKGITFTSNHLENGAQVEIRQSAVTTNNNFFWKGRRPSLNVSSPNAGIGQTTVVKSNRDMFLFYDKEKKPEIKDISEFDVQVGANCSLAFSQSYRYWVLKGVIYDMFIHGIRVCNSSLVELTDFNSQSHLLSSEGRIMPNYMVMNSSYMNNLSTPSVTKVGTDSRSQWLKLSNTYYYQAVILWDSKRLIAGQITTFNQYMTINGAGLLFQLSNGAACGNQVMIRLYRWTSDTNSEMCVDIPVTGSMNFFDNGISVCGFQWKQSSSGSSTTYNTLITTLRYNGKNIECQSQSAPTVGTWENGDIVFNNNILTSNAMWMYYNGVWRVR